MQLFLEQNNLYKEDCLETPVLFRERVRTPERDAEERSKDFGEVDLVISKTAAYHEAKRCLRCYRLYSVVTAKPLVHPYHIQAASIQS